MQNAWSVPRDAWRGETVFIICGGPSVAHADVPALRGRRVIAINDSYQAALAAGIALELLAFGDGPTWWKDNRAAVLAAFAGRIVTAADVDHPRVLRLRNSRPDQTGAKPPYLPLRLSDDPAAVPLRRTTVTLAMNVAWLGGARAIVTLGLDGKAGPGGRTHHHPRKTPPRFFQVEGRRMICWEVQGLYDLAPIVADLGARGCAVLNASPGSAHSFAPVMTLPEALAIVDGGAVSAAA